MRLAGFTGTAGNAVLTELPCSQLTGHAFPQKCSSHSSQALLFHRIAIPTALQAVLFHGNAFPTALQASLFHGTALPTALQAVLFHGNAFPTALQAILFHRNALPTTLQAVLFYRNTFPTVLQAVLFRRPALPTAGSPQSTEHRLSTNSMPTGIPPHRELCPQQRISKKVKCNALLHTAVPLTVLLLTSSLVPDGTIIH